MFYCEKCAERNKWPDDFWLPMSRGRCESCEQVAVCFDVPSSQLQKPPSLQSDIEKCGKPTYKDGKHTGYCVLWKGHEDEGLKRECAPCLVLERTS